MKTVRLLLVLLLAFAFQVNAATYYVDGACGSSGDGSTITCGASGPFKTIMEGIGVLAADSRSNLGGTLNIRAGTYTEYLGLWGDNALQCSLANPCTVQGYQTEIPIITALVRRTDWTSLGGGIWSRVIEARTDYTVQAPADSQNPYHLHEGSSKDGMPYGTSATPAAGKWFYASGTAYINPTGGLDPNTTAEIYVPDRPTVLVHTGTSSACPSNPNCPPMQYVTFRRLIIEGGRFTNFEIYPLTGTTDGAGYVFDQITCRFSGKYCMVGARFVGLVATDITVENFGQGLSLNAGGTFGFRFFRIDGGTLSNFTARQGGNTFAPWMPAKWNDDTAVQNLGNGIQVKQSRNVTLTNVQCEYISFNCFTFDATHLSTLDGGVIVRTRKAASIDEFTPSTAPYDRSHSNTIKNLRVDDTGWNDNGAIEVENLSALTGGEFGAKIHSNIISRTCLGAIIVDSSDKVSIYNNTIWQDRALAGGCQNAALATTGILTTGTNNDLTIKNNIIKDVTLNGIEISSGTTTATGLSIDYNLYHNGDADQNCYVLWSATCYTTLAAFVSAQGHEANGIQADPLLVNPAADNFQTVKASPGVNAGASMGLTTDFYNNPIVGVPDIGAVEFQEGLTPKHTIKYRVF